MQFFISEMEKLLQILKDQRINYFNTFPCEKQKNRGKFLWLVLHLKSQCEWKSLENVFM